MMMFNPKKTPGPWEPQMSTNDTEGKFCTGVGEHWDVIACEDGWMDIDKEDLKAICAVPELLEVYKAACKMKEAVTYGDLGRIQLEIIDLIQSLEERHCK